MKHCVLCGMKLMVDSKDGLCAACHMMGCEDNNCERCIKVATALINFVYRTDEENNG